MDLYDRVIENLNMVDAHFDQQQGVPGQRRATNPVADEVSINRALEQDGLPPVTARQLQTILRTINGR